MVNDYQELKHKCLILPYEEFKQVMDDIFAYSSTDGDGWGTCDFLWEFYNNKFKFNPTYFRLMRGHQIASPYPEDITIEDIAEYFGIENIVEIYCYTQYQNPPVFIIYD